MESPVETTKVYKLTTRNLFNHFLLLHDFFSKFTKVKAPDAEYFDAQLEVNKMMVKATLSGGRTFQAFTLGSLFWFCLKTYNIPLKFAFGFLFVYWTNHFYTLGGYLGMLMKMPSAYKRVGRYFEDYSSEKPNILDKLEQAMQVNENYQSPQYILDDIFSTTYSGQKYVSNDYFVKNKDKYFSQEDINSLKPKIKLSYFDSFLTRYIYHSYTRWFHRLNLFLGLRNQ